MKEWNGTQSCLWPGLSTTSMYWGRRSGEEHALWEEHSEKYMNMKQQGSGSFTAAFRFPLDFIHISNFFLLSLHKFRQMCNQDHSHSKPLSTLQHIRTLYFSFFFIIVLNTSYISIKMSFMYFTQNITTLYFVTILLHRSQMKNFSYISFISLNRHWGQIH